MFCPCVAGWLIPRICRDFPRLMPLPREEIRRCWIDETFVLRWWKMKTYEKMRLKPLGCAGKLQISSRANFWFVLAVLQTDNVFSWHLQQLWQMFSSFLHRFRKNEYLRKAFRARLWKVQEDLRHSQLKNMNIFIRKNPSYLVAWVEFLWFLSFLWVFLVVELLKVKSHRLECLSRFPEVFQLEISVWIQKRQSFSSHLLLRFAPL